MRTATLEETLGSAVAFGPETVVPVVDLYAGIGGFSEGAMLAGHEVRVVVDCDGEAMQWHEANHPHAQHYTYALPDPRLLARLPAPGSRYHLHGSPPCTFLSKACRTDHLERDRRGVQAVRHYLELARSLDPASFSLEQVENAAVLGVLTEFAARFPGWLDFEVVRMEQYGVPQSRKRIIAGSPWLIERLRSARDTFAAPRARGAFQNVPPGAVGLKGSATNRSRRYVQRGPSRQLPAFHRRNRPLAMASRQKRGGLAAPAPTVLANSSLQWTREGGFTLCALTLREHADLQTFPRAYVFPGDRKLAQRLVGNAVPPAFAKLLMSGYRLPVERDGFPVPVWPKRPPSPSL